MGGDIVMANRCCVDTPLNWAEVWRQEPTCEAVGRAEVLTTQVLVNLILSAILIGVIFQDRMSCC